MELHRPIFINPYTDFGFQRLFGEEGNKDLLIDFLNELVAPHHRIADLEFMNSESLPDVIEERKAFFDIHCRAESGETFIVEMQKAKVNFFKDRALFYVTSPIRKQGQRGGVWNFSLEPVYFIAILDFLYEEDVEEAKFRRDVCLKDQDCAVFFDKLHFKFLQMPAFNKEEHALETHFDKWCYFLKHLEEFGEIPQILREPIFEKAFHTARVANFTPEQRDAYEQSMLDYIGLREVAVTAREEGRMEGRKSRDAELALAWHAQGLGIEQIAAMLGMGMGMGEVRSLLGCEA